MTHPANTWFAEKLGNHGVYTTYLEDHHPAHMPCLEIRILDWEQAAKTARSLDMRLVAVWATEGGCHEQDEGMYAYMSFAHPEHRHALLRTLLGKNRREIPIHQQSLYRGIPHGAAYAGYVRYHGNQHARHTQLAET